MKVLGIDIDKNAIRAVEIEAAFRKFEIRDYHVEKFLPNETEPFPAILRLISNLAKKPDKIAIALPTSKTTFRNLDLPTRDRKAIQAAIRFELEDELPFEIDDALLASATFLQSKQATSVHIATTLAQGFEAWLLALKEKSGLDPEVVTTETWGYRTLLYRIQEKAQSRSGPVCVVKIGEDRTTFYLHENGKPLFFREHAWGIQNLGSSTATSRKSMDELYEKAYPFLLEARQANLVCKKLTGSTIDFFSLCGPGALISGIKEMLVEETKVDAQLLRPFSILSSQDVQYSEETDTHFALALGVALTLVGYDRNRTVNFRAGAFAKKVASQKIDLQALRLPIQAALSIGTCMALSLTIQSFYYGTKLKEVDAQLQKAIKTLFTNVSPTTLRGYVSSPKQLRTAMNRELDKHRSLAKLMGTNKTSPLLMLKTLSARIPVDAVVDMIQFDLGAAPTVPADANFNEKDKKEISLTFLFATMQVADRVNILLQDYIADIKKSPPEEIQSQDGSGKKIKITFTGKPKDSAYGL